MITPNIAPRRITGSTAAGLFSAAKSSVRAMERTTNTIVKSPDITKNEKLGINYIQFFGSKKNAKILKKSLKTIRDSLVATFSIAKLLKSEITKISKLFGSGRRSMFGSLVGLGIRGVGFGIKTLLSLAKLLTNPLVLKVLGIAAAVGGTFTLGKFLLDNRDSIKNFIFSRAEGIYDDIQRLVQTIVERIVGKTFKTDVLTNVEFESQKQLDEEFKRLIEKEDMKPQDAKIQATLNEIQRLGLERDKLNTAIDEGTFVDGMTTKEMSDRQKAIETRMSDLRTGDNTLDKLQRGFKLFGIAGPQIPGSSFIKNPAKLFLRKQIRQATDVDGTYLPEASGYNEKSSAEKLKLLKALRNKFITTSDPEEIKTIYTQDLIRGDLEPHEIPQALDMIEFANQLDAVEGDPDKLDVNKFSFSDENTIKPLSLEDVVKTIPKSQRPSQTFLKDIPTLGVTGGNFIKPKIQNGSATDLFQNPVAASSSSSLILHSNFNSDNDYRDFNASELGITF